MGTEDSHYHEWIELLNRTDKVIDLTGWSLKAEDGSPKIELEGTIEPRGFFLLERTSDHTVPNITADLIYTGSLSNKGEYLILSEGSKRIDSVEGWVAGSNNSKRTMERTPSLDWQTSLDPGGTPNRENSPGLAIDPTEQKTEVLPLSAYQRPANVRFAQVFLFGLSLSFFLAALIILIKRLYRKPSLPSSSSS